MEKVIFGFVVLLAATLNLGFVVGDLGDPALHNSTELYLTVVVTIIVTVLKFGDRTQIGATYLATSLVATLQLIAAASVYIYGSAMLPGGLDRALGRLLRTLDNETELTYVTTGERIPGTWLWRVWTNRRAKPSRH